MNLAFIYFLFVDYEHRATLSPNIIEHKTPNYEKLIKSQIFD